MVTLLKPKDAGAVETKPVVKELRLQAGHREWRYAVPFAGVKYYAFQPASPVLTVAHTRQSPPRGLSTGE